MSNDTLITPITKQLRDMHDGQAYVVAEFLESLDKGERNDPDFIAACMDELIEACRFVLRGIERPADDNTKALLKFIDTVEATGGLMTHPDGNTAPKADTEWLDLAMAYEAACQALGRRPMVEDATECDHGNAIGECPECFAEVS